MSANRWKYFRWTPRTAWITFVYVAVVPSAVGYLGFMTDVSGLWEVRVGDGGWGRDETRRERAEEKMMIYEEWRLWIALLWIVR